MQERLEIAQARVEQLGDSLEACKDAQKIVLDTKESVMRSLLRQNVSLTEERDALGGRVEELTSTVEQLARLLKGRQNTLASNSVAPIAPAQRGNLIQGGGGSGGGSTKLFGI